MSNCKCFFSSYRSYRSFEKKSVVKSIFISKKITEDSLFKSNLIPRCFKIRGESFIDFNPVKQKITHSTDWIFFSSKNSVQSYFSAGNTIVKTKTACIGPGTAKELAKYHNSIDFTGNDPNPKKVGDVFSQLIKDGTCLFPISNISNRTIQKCIKNQENVFDVVVYNTQEKGEIKQVKDKVMIFTSPSNSRAYLNKHNLSSDQVAIAMGPSTKKQLEELGVKCIVTPNQPGELGLINCLHSL